MQREVYEAGDDRCIAAQLYDEVERAPVAVFDEFEALVLEAPLVVWDLCGARFPRYQLSVSIDPVRVSGRSARALCL
eukprot:jgi/Tetstr1/454432/TSEL_041332.t1